jgi:hypothetical protein
MDRYERSHAASATALSAGVGNHYDDSEVTTSLQNYMNSKNKDNRTRTKYQKISYTIIISKKMNNITALQNGNEITC